MLLWLPCVEYLVDEMAAAGHTCSKQSAGSTLGRAITTSKRHTSNELTSEAAAGRFCSKQYAGATLRALMSFKGEWFIY